MIISLLSVRAYHGAYRSYAVQCLHVHVRRRSSLSPSPSPTILLSSSQFLTSPLMSHNHSSSTSSNFQLIFDNALKTYKKRTKMDLSKHPLADRLQACHSASSTLAMLQEQVHQLDESQRSNTKLARPNCERPSYLLRGTWRRCRLGMLQDMKLIRDLHSHICLKGILTCKGDLYRIWGASFGVYPS
jgi:hypothetical protein